MQFELSGYVRECVWGPFIPIGFSMLMLIVAIVIYIRSGGIQKAKKDLMKSLIFVLLVFSFGFMQLMQGGIHLFYEREQDAVSISGEISAIEEIPHLLLPHGANIGHGYSGYHITIDGVRCTIIGTGDLQVGDYVNAEYLPNSRFVLLIDKAGKE
jgi:hypothetical protein